MALTPGTVFLQVVDGRTLPESHRSLLRPGEMIRNAAGEAHRLPRFFYEVGSSSSAVEIQLTPHFALSEFLDVDVHEADPLRSFPRYVPCAVTALAAALELLRAETTSPVRIAVNGGYRSPAHAGSRPASPHCWATAANIYRIGSEALDTQDAIERYAAIVRRQLPFARVRPYGHDVGTTDDHLHLDLGYLTLVPPGASELEDGTYRQR